MVSESSIHVVQCPKCGSSVDIDQAHDGYLQCSYCGSTLELETGSSGHPVAKLSRIEASTSFLARAEAERRLRSQLEDCDAKASGLAQQIDELRSNKTKGTLAAVSAAATVASAVGLLAMQRQVGGTYLGCSPLTCAPAFFFIAAIGLWVLQHQVKHRIGKLANELQAIHAERERIASRLEQLEPSLDEEMAQFS